MENISLHKTVKDLSQTKEELKSKILNDGIVWGQGKDPHEHTYRWVLDTKSFLLDPESLDQATQLLKDKLKKYNAEAVGGLTLASHIMSSSLCYQSYTEKNIDAFFVRRKRKEYGMLKLIEGPDISKKKVVIVEDVLNNARYAHEAIKVVEDVGCEVLAVVALINFERNDDILLKKNGYTVESIFTLSELGLDVRSTPKDLSQYELSWRVPNITTTDYTASKSAPVVEGNKVFVGSDQGKMLCFDLNGKCLWEFSTDPHKYGVHSTPALVKDNLVFGGSDGGIYCISKSDGKLIWKNKASTYNGSSPIYDEETNLVYIGLENKTYIGSMAALNADSGSMVWEYSTMNHVPGRAAISKEKIVFGANDGVIYCCDKHNGNPFWKFKTMGENKGRITVDEKFVYAGSFDGFIYCLRLNDGSLVWKKQLGQFIYTAPLLVDDKVIIGSQSFQVSALDKGTGKLLWNFMTGEGVQSYPTYQDGNVFVGSYDGKLYSIDAEDGSLNWKFITSGGINSSPTPYEDKLFVSSNDSYLYCFQKKSAEKNT